ncbi:MAG: hypothetical protein DMG02_16195 [Acidobacteria bacterium]|nr:MAG: hypothetical protein DMG02_16195 [Acidobacteriota bacterium]PYR11200.1 MAG: hypothetical protein DMF99_09230 [Acidobacteriota bacterium]
MNRSIVSTLIGFCLLAAAALAQTPAPSNLPYTAVHDPQFISAAEATFMHDDDRVIGLMVGKTAKAYPAGILSQHGLVEDQSPKGPIAITW